MTPEHPRFHVTIASRFENIELVQVVLADALGKLELGEEARHWIDLSVREAVANAIRHGNREDPTKTVEVELEVEGDELVVRVADEGEGFEPGAVADPLAEDNLLRPGGRGLLYMQKGMDAIDCRLRREGGMVVTLRKRIAPRDDEQLQEGSH